MGFVTFDSRAGAEAAKNALNVSTQSGGGWGPRALLDPELRAGSTSCAPDCESEMVLQHPTREACDSFKADISLGKWMQAVSM